MTNRFAGRTILLIWSATSSWRAHSHYDEDGRRVWRVAFWRFVIAFIPADLEQVMSAADLVIAVQKGKLIKLENAAVGTLFGTQGLGNGERQ